MPEKEEAIQGKLEKKYDFMRGKCAVRRERRLWAEVPREKLTEVAKFLKDDMGFEFLCTITGLDIVENEALRFSRTGYEMIYHLANGGIVLNLKTFIPQEDPVIDTITGVYEGATMYELEVHNLLGITVRGIPEGIKYPLPDDWPDGEYPLRKDWNKEPPVTTQEGG
jgi:membrane-bound hydrogenase subunit beta